MASLEEEDTPLQEEAVVAAKRSLKGKVDFRDISAEFPEPEQTLTWDMDFPTASHSQHVEGGAKDAGFVAAAGRLEESRSQWAICRSHLIIKDAGTEDLSGVTPAAKAIHWFTAAESHATEHFACDSDEWWLRETVFGHERFERKRGIFLQATSGCQGCCH